LDDRRVALDTFRYALQCGQRAHRHLLHPCIEPLWLTGTEELRKAVGDRDRLHEGSVCVV
jgi:hypothetical protein